MNTKENAEQKAYRLIIRDIKLKYQPGDFLLERDLAEHFGVSRTPVTIALNRLVAEGLLQKLPKKGCFIPNLNGDDARAAFGVGGGPTGSTTRSPGGARGWRVLLESEAARLAALHGRKNAQLEIKRILVATEQAIDDDDFLNFTFRDEDFHHAVVHAAENSYLYEAWSRIYLRCNLYTRFFDRLYTRKTPLKSGTLAEHTAIYEALCLKDAGLAARLVAEHCQAALAYVTSTTPG